MKPDVMLILKKLREKRGEAPPEDEDKPVHEEGLDACANDLIEALKAEDTQRVKKALRSAFRILSAEPEDDLDD